MVLNLLKPRIALNKAFLKVKPNRPEIELFKKNRVSDFLKNTNYGASKSIKTKDRNDLVIHNGANAGSTLRVIIEAKSPVNKAELQRPAQINNKAFQGLVLYYMLERIIHRNHEIKHLIVTNIYDKTIPGHMKSQS